MGALLSISIHALRVEGDREVLALFVTLFLFLSTPSGWRATCHVHVERVVLKISIHALRVEGDRDEVIHAVFGQISIHALRVEGDSKNGQSFHLFLRKRKKNLPL